jgi:hypothetical protein
MTMLRFLMFLSLVVWIGGIIFFPVVAQTAFWDLPTSQLAGLVVGHLLGILHWMGITSGIVFLVSSLLWSRFSTGTAQLFALRNILIILMLTLTLMSQFAITPRMHSLRDSIHRPMSPVVADSPARAQFDALHAWSMRLEGAVLILGLVLVYLSARHQPGLG